MPNLRDEDCALKGRTVAVTGGSGFVGGHLVAALVGLCRETRVVDLHRPARTRATAGCSYRYADLANYQNAVDALDGVDLVFHLAGNANATQSVMDPIMDFRANALATCNVANASVRLGVQRVVYLSSAIVYGRPQSFPISEEHPTCPFLPYGASKLGAEALLLSMYHALGLPVVVGRSFVVYGPGEDPCQAGGEVSQFLRWHLNGRPIPVVGDPDAKTRDFIHATDVARALILLAAFGELGSVYNIGTGIELSMTALAELIGRVTGRSARLAPDTSRLDDTYRLVPSISRLQKLGFAPATPLESGIRELRVVLGKRPALPTARVLFRADQPERI
jgi:UDP-glucose 4-epimerase